MVNRSTLGSKDGTGIMQYWGAQKGKNLGGMGQY